MGHFKCRSEKRSNLIQVTFNVECDLDEFFLKKKRSNSKIAISDIDDQSSEEGDDDDAKV